MRAEPEGSSGDAAAEVEDRALMARVQAGDETAFGRLMERWELPAKAVIGRLVLNAVEAEELAHEAFVRVWQQREKYRPGADFRPWLFAIAVNLARNRLRWWRRRPTVSFEAWSEAEGRGGGQSDRIQASSEGGDGLEAKERAEAVRDAIAALPVELREAIVLFEYEGMAQAEIAAIVGATPKAVETRIARARERLRVALRRWER
ncbi:MAG: sigma-70 family RNA polymerase sigma factor [Verrucomicrobia bacterium]|nr:sigma-70 family RNA polymerase sigma factor [Verrucomicrobiota bacterium]